MSKRLRGLLVAGARRGAKNPRALHESLSGMGAVAQKIEAELALWADPEEVGTPDGRKRFDVCDLRIWLKLVDAAGRSGCAGNGGRQPI